MIQIVYICFDDSKNWKIVSNYEVEIHHILSNEFDNFSSAVCSKIWIVFFTSPYLKFKFLFE